MESLQRLSRVAHRVGRVREQRRVFVNWREYRAVRHRQDAGETTLVTRDGVRIAIRHNKWDWVIVEEQFLDRIYLRHWQPETGRQPVVVDIGGYIGDFALYCAGTLDARVVVYEPAQENWRMLEKNLALNPALVPKVTAVNKGVSAAPEVVAHVQVRGSEVHVSSEFYADDPEADTRTFECDTLEAMFEQHALDHVDLLKVDCEGGEFDIFSAATPEIYRRVGSIVLEWHRVPDFEARLAALKSDLEGAGFRLHADRQLLYATRT